jgi:cellulose synthase/poly-beta-1,6-N-acetylglucosamine synthase-like glycosyltransferase
LTDGVAGAERVDGGSGGRRFPVKVVVVDVERLPEEISAAHPGGGRYVGLWVLARVGGEPRSLIKLPFVGDRVTAGELAESFRGPAFEPRASAPVVDADPPVLVSVVLCTTFEREQELRNCLASLAELDYPSYEVVLVDNRRQDGESVAWVEEYPRVRLLRERQPGLAAARNRGLNAAAGEIVAFTDDDVVVDRGWLRAYARRFAAHPEEAALGGFIIPRELETAAQITIEEYYGSWGPRVLERAHYRLVRPTGLKLFRQAKVTELNDAGEILDTFSLYSGGRMALGANMAFRTEALRAVGGFDVGLGVGTPAKSAEDIAVWMRLAWRGYSVGFEPAALLSHVHRREDEQLRRQIENYHMGFTAAMTALVLEDPRHLAAMVATGPRAVSVMTRKFLQRRRTKTPVDADPAANAGVSDLALLELRGMIRGPLAYAHSLRSARRSSRS